MSEAFPLAGIRVVDLGQYAASPFVGLLLAEQGATVVQINPPEGPSWDHPAWRIFQRGKTRVDIDLHDPDGRAAVRELVRGADVLIDGFRPGVTRRLGLAPDEVLADNPGLVYLAMPGFPEDDPRAELAGWEGVVHTATGVYEKPFGKAPVVHPVHAATLVAASWAASAVVGALFARERDGRGQRIDVPLFDAGLAVQEFQALFLDRAPPVWTTLAWASTPFMGLYRCQDGAWVYLHLGLVPHVRRFLELLDAQKWDDASAWRAAVGEATLANPGEPATVREAAWVRQRMEALFASAPAETWEQRFCENGLCLAVCREDGAWLSHPQARATGQVVDLDGLSQPGRAVRLDGPASPVAGVSEAGHVPSWAPSGRTVLDEDTRPPLAGIKVLDLTQVIAGPTCGRTLAELGCEVLRVENPHFVGGFTQPFHLAFSSGKRTMSLDLRTEAGKQAFFTLVEGFRPDIVVESSAPGSLERLGITADALRERVPGLVWVAVSAYDRDGPWGGFKGWEQTAQAVTGTQTRYGGPTPDTLAVPANDLCTGLLAAFGAVCALWRRERTGLPARVDASLVRASLWLQAAALAELQSGEKPASGQDCRGFRALARAYKTRDGWLWVEGAEHDWPAIELVSGLEGISELPRDQKLLELQDRLARRPTADWQQRFRAGMRESGLAVHPRCTTVEAVRDPWLEGTGRVRRVHHDGLGEITMIRHPVTFSRTPGPELEPARPPGSDTAAVFRQYGISGVAAPAPVAHRATPGRLAKVAWLFRQVKWALFRAWLGRRLQEPS